ncbi:hypothetical protein ACFSBZ_00855 [Amnibacterium flavum]|uniref:Linalool dehydratase/isomerase domain-containing protein n=1 Tax=Amnibacterium flavum TaxID=2173173 RepID=A0A2V1HPJ5_9MICO|nr:hypothetical protein [Amnibacterium flavum]PVZ93532.1 hypothetical protein DDQ50_14530 [Amnibacterium flavum]
MPKTITAPPFQPGVAPTPAESGEILSEDQLGHLRHFDNISRLPDNDWSGMLQRVPFQDDGATVRYQLAYASFALALTHLHRLPAAPGLFQPMLTRLIEKMLLPTVWGYWRDVSRGGGALNSYIQRDPEWDPVARENIMYSGYLQTMITLNRYLFDDRRFDAPDSIVLDTASPFWGGSSHRFTYDRESLNENLYWQLVENGYLGIACQPNCIFQICIQPSILSYRLNDFITGGARADEITAGYKRAWEEFGQLDETGHFTCFVQYDLKNPIHASDITVNAWLGTLLNMWDPALVRDRYSAFMEGELKQAGPGELFVTQPSGSIEAQLMSPMAWVAPWASEIGDQATVDGLLAYADSHLGREWRDGGLFYRRNDTAADDLGRATLVDPLSGNVMLGYSRLNIPDGLWRLYNRPLAPDHHRTPALVRVADDIDVSQAVFDRDAARLTFRVRRRTDLPLRGRSADAGTVEIGRLGGQGEWELRRGSEIISSGTGDTLVVECPTEATTFTLTKRGGDHG